ncbi:unnamed protein product [Tilletia laevis]|uniref:Uncharacterized protein n=2 Tax=Tilletia TaxID=13289 RepID=A0A177UAI9_9BASI|nr:hypothetical protein CF336_g6802 [Tilletia laevis]KAE8251977.1 hypothetical protein A4X03_0g6277 [Tilletia caries]KAE8190994.1 hypothetical protein CF335_g6204 [Tilletia laevis]CAD6886632.1 unnamed protein product [Tilletia caries]CAD6897825.1 unnamed protein product [Tilletia laevis]
MADAEASTSRGQQHDCQMDHSVLTSRAGHQVHNFKRIYLGPSPVTASKAVSVALALAQAEAARKRQLELAAKAAAAAAAAAALPPAVADGGPITAVQAAHALQAPSSAAHPGDQLKRSETRIPLLPAESTSTDTESPRTRRIELPREIPPATRDGDNSTDTFGMLSPGRLDVIGGFKRRTRLFRDRSDASFASNASFQSARSMPSSVLSEPALPLPQSFGVAVESDARRLPRASTSTQIPQMPLSIDTELSSFVAVDAPAEPSTSEHRHLQPPTELSVGGPKDFPRGRSRSEGGPRARSRSRSRGMLTTSASAVLPRMSGSRGASSSQIVTLAPGAVGTSAGGTKWVGTSFEVGATFHEVAGRRRERVRELEKQKAEDAKREKLKAEEEEEQRRQRGSIFLVLNDHQPFSPVSPPRSAMTPGGTFMGSGWLPANPITEHDEDDVPRAQDERTLDIGGRVADVRRPSDVLSTFKNDANRDTSIRSREASGTFDDPSKPDSSTSGLPNVNFDLPPGNPNGNASVSLWDPPVKKPNGTANGSVPHTPIPFPTSSRKGLPGSGTSTAMQSEEDIPLQRLNKPAPNSRSEQDPTVSRKTILKRDRMLIKEDWTPAEDLPADFDELAARKYSIHNDKWRELVVILRMRRVELWQESRVRRKKPTLKLRTSIPLYSSETHLSVYSKADNIFCLTFEPSRRRALSGKGLVHLRRSGTNIILFNPRFPSAAVDWMWEIWRELGGMIPASIDVHMPTLDLHVRLPVPEEIPDHEAAMLSERTSTTGALLLHSSLARKHGHAEAGQEGYKIVNRQSVIGLVVQLVEAEPQLRELLDWLVAGGQQLELAWRRGTALNWIIQDMTVEMEPRCWALLSGAMFKTPNSGPVLELRAAAHNQETINNGTREKMEEPPAIEGFLWRVRPVSNTLDRIYLTAYDGHLFACRPSKACPPDRHFGGPNPNSLEMRVPRTDAYTAPAPGSRRMGNASVEYDSEYMSKPSRARSAFEILFGRTKTMKQEDEMSAFRAQVLDLIRFPGDSDEELDAQERLFQTWQRRRQFEQIDGADGYVDLRDLHAFRTLAEVDGMPTEALQTGRVRDLIQRDLGGEEHMNASEDKALLRKLRQFEVVHSNGRSIRLESYSAPLTQQWIKHLTELRVYWKRKERLDALTLMQVQGDIDPVKFSEKAHRALAEKDFRHPVSQEERVSPLLSSLWNWCIIEGCRGIIRSGKLYHKHSAYAPYERGHFILIGGRLLGYALSTSERTSRARQNADIFWRRRSEAGGMRTIPLRDAYIFSGPLTDAFRGAKNASFEGGAKTPAGSLGCGTGAASTGGSEERHTLPRVYADGMISMDEDEDCTFVIRFRKQHQDRPSTTPGAVRPLRKMADRGSAAAAALFAADEKNSNAERSWQRAKETQDQILDDGRPAAVDPGTLPRLRDLKNVEYLVMRARSKLEKEVWVWAIRLEIERLVRDDPERDEALRKLEVLDGEADSKYRRATR